MNHQEDINVRMKSQRRTLKIYHYEDVHVDAKCLGDSSLEILEQPNACERQRRKLVAAAPKRAPLQQRVRPLQGYAGWQGVWISLQCLLDEPKAASQATVPRYNALSTLQTCYSSLGLGLKE